MHCLPRLGGPDKGGAQRIERRKRPLWPDAPLQGAGVVPPDQTDGHEDDQQREDGSDV
jgi:hypothetical protein